MWDFPIVLSGLTLSAGRVCVCALCALCALHAFSHQKSLVIIFSLSQPIVELEQQFKKFLKDCIKMDLFIVYQRPAIYKKPRFFLVL